MIRKAHRWIAIRSDRGAALAAGIFHHPPSAGPRVAVRCSRRCAPLCPFIVLLALALTSASAAAGPAGSTQPPAKGAALLAAGDSVMCTIRSIHGLAAPGGGLDKRLRPLHKQFARPPFSSFKTIKLLKAAALEIPRNGTKQTKLPTGKILKLSFKEKLLGRKDKIRLRMHLSITPPKKTRFLPGTLFTIANGGTLLVAGDKYNGGTHVVGVTCQAK